jgi:hypothetical protein
MMDSFWMIWNPMGHAPTYKHVTPESARAEAQRLARMNPGSEFYVLRAEAKCQLNEFRWEEAADFIPF